MNYKFGAWYNRREIFELVDIRYNKQIKDT